MYTFLQFQLDKTEQYEEAIVAFVERHPAAKNWLKGKLYTDIS